MTTAPGRTVIFVHLAEALIALGGAFLAAGILARAGARIGLPTIPLFMLAGILFGPNTPGIALVDDPTDLKLLGAVGLVFLLFYLGLEFHPEDLVKGGRRLAWIGVVYLLLNVGGGFLFGLALGWGGREALVLAGVIGISSSAIVTKVLVDLGRFGLPEGRLIMSIIVIDDVFLALYLAVLQPVLGGADDFGAAALDFGKAFGFLILLASIARWGGRIVGRFIATRDDELLVVMFTGLAILTAGIAEELGVSDAMGAFLIGLILGATKSAPRIRRLVHPLRDAFAAIFFFSFGLSIDPGDVVSVAGPVSVAIALTFVLNAVSGIFSAKLYGFDRAQASGIVFTILARGEFALVLASIAATAGLDARLAPFIAGYVLVLAVVSPLAANSSDLLARGIPGFLFREEKRKDPGKRGGGRFRKRGGGPDDGREASPDDGPEGGPEGGAPLDQAAERV